METKQNKTLEKLNAKKFSRQELLDVKGGDTNMIRTWIYAPCGDGIIQGKWIDAPCR